ncbi:MAG: hypothetical protein IT432_11395 [Phycisphaerales bacterium]|nr:hypothetical protein [Phycisphaerales bacterium]
MRREMFFGVVMHSRPWLFALLAMIFGVFAPTRVSAAVAYQQSPDPTGGQYKSSWYPPDGLDGDEYVWDNFTLASTTAITEIRWRGAYAYGLADNIEAPVIEFKVSIWPSNSSGFEPNVAGQPLVKYWTGNRCGETYATTIGGIKHYDYSFTLPSPFQATGGVKYWVQIEASQGINGWNWPPDWSISKGTGGNGAHFRKVTGGNYANISGDCAFTLLNSDAQTFHIAASASPANAGVIQGAGDYPVNATATLTATANSGWGFLNWTENSQQVSTNWRYSFTVTRDRTLVANFVPAFTITTDSYPLYGGTTTGGGVFNQGSSITVSATPRLGFDFVGWTVYGNTVSTSNPYTFTPTASVPIVAQFVNTTRSVTFDTDSGNPPPMATMTSTPFSTTKNGLTASYHSPDGMSFFSVQSDATILWINQHHMENQYLFPGSVYRNDLQIDFSRSLTSVSLDFATIEMESWADVESPLQVSAYLDSTDTPPVAVAQARGVYGGTTYPEGFVELNSASPFNIITITVAANPFGTNNFLLDNVTAIYSCLGDFNNDGFVNALDYDEFAGFFEVADPAADINNDGFVNALDYDEFASAFEAGC